MPQMPSAGLRARVALDRHGFRTAHALGQNFLLDDALLARLLDDAALAAEDNVLEIGPGAGVMTALMAERARRVLAVEVDERLAPVLGAMLLQITDWRGAFEVLTVAGLIVFVLSFLYKETLPEEERLTGSAFASIGKLVTVGKNPGFLVPCVIFSLYNFAFMGYISVSSYIYVDFFGLSEQMYSYFFAVNALVSLLGPVVYVRFLLKMDKQKLIHLCFFGYIAAGIILLLLGQRLPLLFWIGFAPFTFCGSLIRPFSSNLLLEQQKGDTGSASSLLNGIFTCIGSLGMMSVSAASNGVLALGSVVLASGLISLLGWTLLMRSKITVVGVKE